MKLVSFREYVQEILKTAEYEPCEDSDCVVAIIKALPGCMTQGRNVEEARELLIDARDLDFERHQRRRRFTRSKRLSLGLYYPRRTRGAYA